VNSLLIIFLVQYYDTLNDQNLSITHTGDGPFGVAGKTITKSSKFVKYVIKFADITNPVMLATQT
jgi:hypothetical protein